MNPENFDIDFSALYLDAPTWSTRPKDPRSSGLEDMPDSSISTAPSASAPLWIASNSKACRNPGNNIG